MEKKDNSNAHIFIGIVGCGRQNVSEIPYIVSLLLSDKSIDFNELDIKDKIGFSYEDMEKSVVGVEPLFKLRKTTKSKIYKKKI